MVVEQKAVSHDDRGESEGPAQHAEAENETLARAFRENGRRARPGILLLFARACRGRFGRGDWPPTLHSYFNAVAGSTREAWRAGR